jgi:two-component system chemotaxis response regulator CheB
VTGGRRIRVLVVDDSAFVRKAIERMLGTAADIEVVGFAGDGEEGLAKARELRPDVVTLDVKMPRLGGLETLERLMAEQPVPVLLLSTLTQEGAEVTLRGLELGALDFVDKSSVQPMSMLSLAGELVAKIRALGGARTRARPMPARPRPGGAAAPPAQCVVVAASTGGPSALQALLGGLPVGFPAAVLVVQHIPRGFTKSLSERLDARSTIPVRVAGDGEAVEPGRVLLAPAGIHAKLARRSGGVEVVLDEPREVLHRPSADVLMASAAEVYGPLVVGVVLTGMGADGTEGLRAIREKGGLTLAESEETCIIYGMPKAAIEAGVVHRVAPLHALAGEILAAV